jgi:hypothetical protein
MLLASKKPSFGQDLVEAMKLVLAHHRGEIQLEQVLPKPRVPARKATNSKLQVILLRLE